MARTSWPRSARQRAGELEPFILVIEGSIPNQNIIEGDGYWTSFGNDLDTGQPLTVNWWIDQLAPKAWAVMAVGTCATYGGIHAMAGNPTGAMGLGDYLGWDFQSAGGPPDREHPRLPRTAGELHGHPDLDALPRRGHRAAPPLDGMLRPQWIFDRTVHDGCDRASYYEQGNFATDFNEPKCHAKLGCWGPVVNCNVPKRGWIGGVGGCPNVGGICIGCTMPGFPDAFMPFMDEPAGGELAFGGDHQGVRRLRPPDASASPAWR